VSTRVFFVIAAAMENEVVTDWALVPSWARTIVNVSVETAVTRTISAFAAVGDDADGHRVALNGTAGAEAPSPDWTTSDVPEVAGDGAVATVADHRLA
jgi:hypothetical protein